MYIYSDYLNPVFQIIIMTILSVVMTGARLGLAGGAVWVSNEMGVWGDAKKGELAYNKLVTGQLNIKSLVPASFLENCPFPAIELPDTGVAEAVSGACQTVGEARQNFWSNYNSGVRSALTSVSDLPSTIQGLGSQAVEWVQEQAKTE